MKLYQVFTEGDADLVEINPLILTPEDTTDVIAYILSLREHR